MTRCARRGDCAPVTSGATLVRAACERDGERGSVLGGDRRAVRHGGPAAEHAGDELPVGVRITDRDGVWWLCSERGLLELRADLRRKPLELIEDLRGKPLELTAEVSPSTGRSSVHDAV